MPAVFLHSAETFLPRRTRGRMMYSLHYSQCLHVSIEGVSIYGLNSICSEMAIFAVEPRPTVADLHLVP